MADDGLLMNFAATDALLAVRPTYRGGRWKDRLQVKRNAQRWYSKSGPGAASQQSRLEPTLERPFKKLKTADGQGHVHSQKSQNSAAPRDVISSLFTYNPEPQATVSKDENGPETAVLPTNAPLIDGLDTFTSLGLSAPLAAHLLTKLDLKAPTAIQKSAIEQLVKEDSDAFIQAETGSGKTLAYLLPIVQRIMELSKQQDAQLTANESGRIHRDSGLFAIILAPTRELSKQISVVLESLLRCANWIVAGTVIGGEKKKSEKARLRKGLNILVATPGRLADHLLNTEALDVSNVRWLVLDEGDRLMELGFEEEIKGIVTKLEQRRRQPKIPLPGLPTRRTTVLCSATMKTNVERLGDISLQDAVHIKADPREPGGMDVADSEAPSNFSAPAQLKQSYIIVPPKQRFVTLAALLKRTFARKGSVMKAIVFISCADSVDFHFAALSQKDSESETATISPSTKTITTPTTSKPSIVTHSSATTITSPTNPGLTLYKLHGSLPQVTRTSTLSAFSRSSKPGILLCTDVASRGLDLPSIDLVVEYDPAFSAEDHLHRIGRTARAGRDGRATIFLMPGPEEEYVNILKQSYKADTGAKISHSHADETLRRAFAPEAIKSSGSKESKASKASRVSWEDAATDFQLVAEQWVIGDVKAGELARKAYISHVRAYATHTIDERHMFDVKGLHLGHLAKAFALRDRPGIMGRAGGPVKKRDGKQDGYPTSKTRKKTDDNDEERAPRNTERDDASRRMRAAMKVHMTAANEFNIG